MPKLLTQGVSSEPETGRSLIGIVAGFKSERWPDFDRNGGRLQVGIRRGLRNEDTALHYWAMVPTYKGKLAQSIEESGFEFDAIVRAPSNSDDVQPYYDVVSKRWPVHDLSKNITRKGMVKASANETTVEDLTDSEFAYMLDGEEPNLRSVLIIDESCSTGKTIAAVQELLWRAGMPRDARVVAAVCCKML